MCQTCFYWHAINLDNRMSGTCRHNAPKLIELRYVETRTELTDAHHLIWPVTSHDDGCGDWAPQDDE